MAYRRYRHGAVIMRGGNVLATGISKLHSEPHLVDCSTEFMRQKISCHAEVDALKKCKNTKNATMYVARIGRNDMVALSKPCFRCEAKIRESGIKKVIYSIDPETYGIWQPR